MKLTSYPRNWSSFHQYSKNNDEPSVPLVAVVSHTGNMSWKASLAEEVSRFQVLNTNISHT